MCLFYLSLWLDVLIVHLGLQEQCLYDVIRLYYSSSSSLANKIRQTSTNDSNIFNICFDIQGWIKTNFCLSFDHYLTTNLMLVCLKSSEAFPILYYNSYKGYTPNYKPKYPPKANYNKPTVESEGKLIVGVTRLKCCLGKKDHLLWKCLEFKMLERNQKFKHVFSTKFVSIV